MFRKKMAIVCVILSLVVGVYLVGTYWLADVMYEDAQTDIQSGHYSQGAYKLLGILKYHYEHVYEDKLSIALIGASLTTEDKKDTDKLVIMSEYYNEKALQASPYNVLYWKSRASILYNAYQVNSDKKYLEEALSALQTAEEISPTDPRLPYTGAQYASLLYDVEKKPTYIKLSQEQIQTALKLKPDYLDALEFKASLLQKMDKKKEALQLFLQLKKLDPTNEEINASIKELSK
jgi:tetratricopeptide (TPR) repeat protein